LVVKKCPKLYIYIVYGPGHYAYHTTADGHGKIGGHKNDQKMGVKIGAQNAHKIWFINGRTSVTRSPLPVNLPDI